MPASVRMGVLVRGHSAFSLHRFLHVYMPPAMLSDICASTKSWSTLLFVKSNDIYVYEYSLLIFSLHELFYIFTVIIVVVVALLTTGSHTY